jgi:hypothetical protein
MHYTLKGWLPALVSAVVISTTPDATLRAQTDATPTRSWKMGVATGPSFFYGDEGNTVGLQIESALMRRIRSSRLWVRAEMTTHLYGAQNLYPCLLNANGTCFSTSRRSVFGGGMGLQYFFREASEPGRGIPHLVLGVATYVSNRRAEQPQVCQPSAVCGDVTPSLELTDTNLGVNVGFGQTWSAGRNEFFIESRLHQPIVGSHDAGPYSHFRIFPLSIGVRF